jgi:hypothetical protein
MIAKTKDLLDSNDVKGMEDWYIRVNYLKSKQHSMSIGENIQSALIEMDIPVEIGKEFSGQPSSFPRSESSHS